VGVAGYRGAEGAGHCHTSCLRGGGGEEEALEAVEEVELC
jgi:hypothetical protein